MKCFCILRACSYLYEQIISKRTTAKRKIVLNPNLQLIDPELPFLRRHQTRVWTLVRQMVNLPSSLVAFFSRWHQQHYGQTVLVWICLGSLQEHIAQRIPIQMEQSIRCFEAEMQGFHLAYLKLGIDVLLTGKKSKRKVVLGFEPRSPVMFWNMYHFKNQCAHHYTIQPTLWHPYYLFAI